MGGILQNYVEFDAGTEEGRRTIDFRETEDQSKLTNEYNISVYDSSGDPVSGTVIGIVSANFYSPGADRPETTANQVDLSTGCRKFNIFIATIDRAVFSVTGLAAGNKVRVEAIRGSR